MLKFVRMRTGLLLVAGLGIGLGGALVAVGGYFAEGSLHPARVPVATVCPCIARMSCGDARVTSPDGTELRAWYYKPQIPTVKAILLLHGVGGNREQMVSLGNLFLQHGYSVLEPDLRGHGESGGFTTYGLLEEADIKAWAGWMLAQPGVTAIYGFGASLGGSVLLESLNREQRFHGVIAESAYSTFPDVANERLAREAGCARFLAAPVVSAGFLWTRIRYGADLRSASMVEAVRQTLVPVFLIHWLADPATSPDNSRRIAAANPAATLWLVPGGGHADIWKLTGKVFESRVLGWLGSLP
jgi:pimeloyl-ACP methyl ester carboxylesterase